MLKVIKTLVTTIMLKLSNASIIYCNTTLIVSFASLEFQFENVNRKIEKYSSCSWVQTLPLWWRTCVRWRNTWPATSNHQPYWQQRWLKTEGKYTWKYKIYLKIGRKKRKNVNKTKSLLNETTFSIVSCVYDLVCLHLVWYGLKVCLFKLNVLG